MNSMPEVVQVICFSKRDSDGIQTVDVDPLSIDDWEPDKKEEEDFKPDSEFQVLIPEFVIGTPLDDDCDLKLEADPIHVETEIVEFESALEYELSPEADHVLIDPDSELGPECEAVSDSGLVLIEPETVLVPETSVDLEPDIKPDPGLMNALDVPIRIRLSSSTSPKAKAPKAAHKNKRKKPSLVKIEPPKKKARTAARSKSVRSQIDESSDVGFAGPQPRVRSKAIFSCKQIVRWQHLSQILAC